MALYPLFIQLLVKVCLYATCKFSVYCKKTNCYVSLTHNNFLLHFRMDYWLIAYIIIAIILGSSLVAYLFKREQTIGAMVLLVLLLLTFIFYGLRWFPGGKLNGTGSAKVAWPPIVNMCPDFMVAWVATTADNTKGIAVGDTFCYDINNIYGLQTAAEDTNIKLVSGITINGLANQSALKVGLAADAPGKKMSVVAPLPGTISPVQSYANKSPNSPLRWEGVTDGSTVTLSNISTA